MSQIDKSPISRNHPDWQDQACDESGFPVAKAPHANKTFYGTRPLGHVKGVGPDAPTVVTKNGAKQSGSPYRCDLLPAKASLHIAEILKYGAEKYGDNNWRGLTVSDHVNHAMTHLFAFQAGDITDDHLGHAACRMLMALDTNILEASADTCKANIGVTKKDQR